MRFIDQYIRSIYFVDGKIGKVRISNKLMLLGILHLPLLIFWFIWKGLYEKG
ncbi:hypothetical protein ACFOWU_05240 [Epilithonimonas zeae]|uniref:hypothetical protein n=1 Tax=Epilithonimonas zeae TaxID=1416779 RepID=UPI00158813AC|nr:hypothetical protein [Epilithonimonas zeae]